ncbi:hypothetical protein [Nostoc sp. UHCC 0251]|nr:hypothetical protein [Nostoc sp. UHCC 0251]MEA5621838.1 hypothetical protein [Nostoc sp. UHCC 0251]
MLKLVLEECDRTPQNTKLILHSHVFQHLDHFEIEAIPDFL